jgi:hypothetical protein
MLLAAAILDSHARPTRRRRPFVYAGAPRLRQSAISNDNRRRLYLYIMNYKFNDDDISRVNNWLYFNSYCLRAEVAPCTRLKIFPEMPL